MNFFKRNSSGYTLLEIILTISIISILIMLCYTVYQRQHKKILSNECYLDTKKECLNFFTKVSQFMHISLHFLQKNAQTLALELAPTEENISKRHLEIQLNGKQRNKNILNFRSKHIYEFSWTYWDSQKKMWKILELGKIYSNLSFIKVMLLDKNKKILDTFVFSCLVSEQNISAASKQITALREDFFKKFPQ